MKGSPTRRAFLLSLAMAAASPMLLAAGPTTRPSELTFVISGDTHFGANGMEATNRRMVEQMNRVAGMAWPTAIGGKVGTPRGLIHVGDVTDCGLPEEFDEFARIYGSDGRDGLLKYPVYETIGNHDIPGMEPVKALITTRHGSFRYSWDWDNVHFISMGLYPDEEGLTWLKDDLAKVGRKRRTIIYFHYPVDGPYSQDMKPAEKKAFGDAIEEYNVVAIFHGHFHRTGRYEWRNHPVFLPGSPRHSSHYFMVARITDTSFSVGTWNFDTQEWAGSFKKDLTDGASRPSLLVRDMQK